MTVTSHKVENAQRLRHARDGGVGALAWAFESSARFFISCAFHLREVTSSKSAKQKSLALRETLAVIRDPVALDDLRADKREEQTWEDMRDELDIGAHHPRHTV